MNKEYDDFVTCKDAIKWYQKHISSKFTLDDFTGYFNIKKNGNISSALRKMTNRGNLERKVNNSRKQLLYYGGFKI